MNSKQTYTAPQLPNRVRLVVASSVMLTFISFWRAAAIVLCDLGSSAFYAGGIAEEAIGKAAPWFVLGVMFFSFAVRAVYVESCTMFTRGGVYRVVKEALGGTVAKLTVSALMFDYILTGPISGVSAGQYITGLINLSTQILFAHHMVPAWVAQPLPLNGTSACFAAAVTLYYWWENIKGIEESSDKALKVMQVTTVMVVILLTWGIISVIVKHASLPPFPIPSNLRFEPSHGPMDPGSLGFLEHTPLAVGFGLFGILMAFGHSILAMSGEESLAQVNREIEHPKLKNLKRAAIVIALYSFIFTGVGTMLGAMLLNNDKVPLSEYHDNLLSAMTMHMVGPFPWKFAFSFFVVIVGFLILAGAVNTAIVGSTGVLMRVAEDGVLMDWFRKPQRKYGTPSRIINLVCGLQMLTIVLSGGDVFVLGEAYAFGVIWSFTFKALAMLVLRWKYKGAREWKVPVNIRIGKVELPIGLFSVFLVLATTAIVNLFTKSVATVSGIIFSLAFFIIFSISEYQNKKRMHMKAGDQMKEHFQLEHSDTVGRKVLAINPGCVVVTMRDFNNPFALKWTLARTNTAEQEIVVLAARMMGVGGPEYVDASEQLFSEHEQMLFTKAVSVAESFGKKISLLVVPAGDIFAALVQTANSLEAAAVVAGLSTKITAQDQAYRMGQAWEQLPEPKRQFTFYIVSPDGSEQSFHIGPHDIAIPQEDVELVHRLWLNFRRDETLKDLHHSDVVSFALTRLATDYVHDKAGTTIGLRENLDATAQPIAPGDRRYERLEPLGPGLSIRAPKPDDQK